MPLAVVLFALDPSRLRDSERDTLQRNADYLRKWNRVRVSIEGHADSRGTNEYNLALGERRANAVREYLVGLGITGDRLVVVSKGEEAPVCTEEAESCWSRNRRGHFVITGK
jgi:peptidoglycan-associated lipoprotein